MNVHQPSYPYFFLFLFLFLLAACSTRGDGIPTGNNPPSASGEWSIPRDQVLDGGPGKDGIPSIDRPRFSLARDITFLDPDDLVVGIKIGEDARAYPHPILDWHEIVNDEVDNQFIAIIYCPLTGTGVAWNRQIGGLVTTFGVSGLLYNSNIIPYDRETDSNWSQMLLESVQGELRSREIETFPLVETTWATWLAMYPDSRVLNTDTGFNRNYTQYPYGAYRTNDAMLVAPIQPDDNRLPRKDRGMGIIDDGNAKFYPLREFSGGLSIVTDRFGAQELVIAGSSDQNFLVAYERLLEDGTLLEFTPLTDVGQPAIMVDQEGNAWNFFGEAVAGPRQGITLRPVTHFMGYWMAWGTFYPDLPIFER